jgi:Holliday junction resolvase RusA-like endonuclease
VDAGQGSEGEDVVSKDDRALVKLTQRKTFWITNVNPQPWQAPRGAKRFGTMTKHETLKGYQNAVKEQMADLWPYGPFDGNPNTGTPVALSFVFWRQIESVQDARGNWHRGQVADATNLQKALEDALQGVLFTYDRYTADVRSRVIEQSPYTEPKIGIAIKPADNVVLQLELDFDDE